MKKHTMFGAALFTLLAALSVSGCHHRSPEGRVGWIVEETADRLELDAAQRERLDAMAREFLERRKAMRADREALRETLMAEIKKEHMDRAVIDALVADKRRQMTEFSDFMVDNAMAFHDMLTPEQREKLVSELEKFHARAEKYGRGHW